MSYVNVKLATLFVMLASGFGGGFAAGGPKVATDIPPVHSLVAAVMGDVGTPALVVRPRASPHGYAMAPSEARALSQADVVFWIGPALTPWLGRAIETLAPKALSVALMEADGVATLPFRQGVLFASHGHEDHDNHGGEHDEEGTAYDEEGHADHDDHAHHGEAQDPHVWLDPRNALAMTRAIIGALTTADPTNADTYVTNGEKLVADLRRLEVETIETLTRTQHRPFVVFHDAYHYFEARFGVEAAGAIAMSDAAQPGPARLTEIRAAIRDLGAPCVFAEPQFPEAHAQLVMEGTGAKLAVLDPMGATLTPGAGLYPAMMRRMADAMVGCLAE
jgi:zinc transport system substrate-binding protein